MMVSTEGDDGRVAFLGMWPGHLYKVPHSEGLHAWFYSLPVAILKFLITSPLNLCFVSDDCWGMGHIHAQRSYMQFACPPLFLAIPLAYGLLDARAEPQCSCATWDFSKTHREYKVSVLRLRLSQQGALAALRGHAFCLNQNLLQMQKEGNGVLRKPNNLENFLTSLSY